MSKAFRVISTLLIATGIGFLFVYVHSQSANKIDILSQPSYYVMQNYWYVFVAGIAAVVFSLLGSFFSWFKRLETGEEVLPNAGYVSGKDINTWLEGSTVELESRTELIPDDFSEDDETELISEEAGQ